MMFRASFEVSKVFAFLLLFLFLLCLLLTIMQLFCPSEVQTVEAVTQPELDETMRNFVAVGNATADVKSAFRPAIGDYQNQQVLLSRRKRFVAFPEGSSLTTAVCMTTGVLGNPEVSYLSLGLNWGIAYELPNSSWVLRHAQGFPDPDKTESAVDTETPVNSSDVNAGVKQVPIAFVPSMKRRQRRDLYGKLETLMDKQ